VLEIGLLLLLVLVIGWNILFPQKCRRDEGVIYLRPDPLTRDLDEALVWAAGIADSRMKGKNLGEAVIISIPLKVRDLDDRARFALDWLEKNGAAGRVYIKRHEAGWHESEDAS
jgi:hypothetical protein